MLLLWPVLVGPASAQRAVIAGVVMDTAGNPLEGAQVAAIRARQVKDSDRSGRFLFTGLPAGREVFQVRRIGYLPQLFDLELAASDTLRLGVTLARDSVQRLPEVGVTAPAPPTPGERLEREALERILWSGAPARALIRREELSQVGGGRLFPLLLKHGLSSRIDHRGGDLVTCRRSSGRPVVYLDGLRMGADFSLENFSPDQAELVEVYATSISRPTQYNTTGSGCTVLIWTRR